MGLVCGVCGAHGRYESAEARDVRRNGGGRGLCGGSEKRVDGVLSGRPQSPGREGMAQDGGTRGGTFHGEIDRCSERQGWTTACNVTGRTKERIAQSKRAHAGSLAIVD